MKVPFLDLKAQYDAIREEILRAVEQVMDSSAFAGGPFVEAFEREFATFCQCREAVGVGSGTDALWLALAALGVGRGDEVITVPNTFIATVEAISQAGATPVFVDVDRVTHTMDPGHLERAITRRTKAIMPVHLYGQMADMDPIMEIARARELFVVEDAAQAHGSLYKGRPAGSIGDAGCFSFYPGKNLGAYGEGGAVVTNQSDVAERIRQLRDHGQSKKYYHSKIGWNCRLDGIQGAVLSVKLKHLPAWNEARRQHARRYAELLAGIDGVEVPGEAAYARHIYHVYALATPFRNELKDALAAEGVSCAIHYPVPVHLQEAYAFLGIRPGSFPEAERNAEEELSLPMFPELDEARIRHVAESIGRFTRTLCAQGGRKRN